MAWASVNGKDVVAGTIRIPRIGAWVADLVVDADAPAGLLAGVNVWLDEGASIWQGTTYRGGDNFGRIDLRVVGGAAGLGRPLTGQGYRNVSVKALLGDIIGGAGEKLSLTSSPSLLSQVLTHWTRMAGPASSQLSQLVSMLGASWRVLQDGTIWVGTESWPASRVIEYDAIERDVPNGSWVIGSLEGYRILPGQTFEGRRVDVVEHRILPDHTRTTLWFQT